MDALRKLRERKGLTQKEVAEEIGISLIMYSYIEQGRRRPSDKNKIKIASYYQTSVQEIFFDEGITNSNN